MRQHYWELRGLGIELVAAANDTPETNLDLRERYDLPFTILSDEEGNVAEAYGALHENEPRGRRIARVSMFLISPAEEGARIAWEYVGPTSRHRVAPSRLSQEVQTYLGFRHQTVSVVVPSAWRVEHVIAGFQDPPLGLFRTPDDLNEPGVLVYRDYMRELAMHAHGEVFRLQSAGWTLAAVSTETEGAIAIGQRYVFTRERQAPTPQSP